MESVTRFWSHEAQNIRCVREADFDRVSAENLALQEELKQQKRYVEINANSAHGKHMEGLRYRDERDALQLLLNDRDGLEDQLTSLEQRRHAEQQACQAAERRVKELEAALKFYADREHYHFESGNWDTVSGEPLNILWCGDEPDFIEDGTVARAALNHTAEAVSNDEPQCLLCLDNKTVPGNIPGGSVKDCPDCCGEEG